MHARPNSCHRDPGQEQVGSGAEMSNLMKGVIAAIVILVLAGAAALYFRSPNPAPDAPIASTPDGKMSAAGRNDYIESATASCKRVALSDQRVIDAHIAEQAVGDYCRCVAEKSADVITIDEANATAKDQAAPPSLMSTIEEISTRCRAQYLTIAK